MKHLAPITLVTLILLGSCDKSMFVSEPAKVSKIQIRAFTQAANETVVVTGALGALSGLLNWNPSPSAPFVVTLDAQGNGDIVFTPAKEWKPGDDGFIKITKQGHWSPQLSYVDGLVKVADATPFTYSAFNLLPDGNTYVLTFRVNKPPKAE